MFGRLVDNMIIKNIRKILAIVAVCLLVAYAMAEGFWGYLKGLF